MVHERDGRFLADGRSKRRPYEIVPTPYAFGCGAIMATTIGVMHVTLYLEASFSLKDKRGAVKSLTHKVRNQFNVGIAEVTDLDDMRVATLAVVCVSNHAGHADEMLQTVLRFIDQRVELGVLGEVTTELIPYGE